MTTHYYTSGGSGAAIAAAGFNLCDVSSVSALNALPAGMQGLVWLGESDGATTAFIAKVRAFIGNPKLFGFFLCDEPDITGKWSKLVTPANLMAEADYIHANVPGAKVFVTLMNMGSSAKPSYANTFNQANTHVDLFGISAYPIRSEVTTFDYAMVDKSVAAAIASGITPDRVVPTYQTFGGGNWVDDSGGKYVLPTASQLQTMFDRWAVACPNPVFDYAYAWGAQNGDVALGTATDLQAVCLKHNTGAAPAPAPTPAPAPAPTQIMLNGQIATQAGIDALVAAANKSDSTIAAIKGLVA